jgi:flagellin
VCKNPSTAKQGVRRDAPQGAVNDRWSRIPVQEPGAREAGRANIPRWMRGPCSSRQWARGTEGANPHRLVAGAHGRPLRLSGRRRGSVYSDVADSQFDKEIVMTLRINHNTASMNAQRNLEVNDHNLMRSLERLSSGLKVNRAADGAATLIISEQMRAQISGIQQAVDNSQQAIGMIQTTESALTEVNNLMVKIRQLGVHAANEGANDRVMLQADQFEIDNALDTIDQITFNTQFGLKRMLDGSQGANGAANGKGLDFLGASPKTHSSPVQGYSVKVQRLGTQATLTGSTSLTQEIIDKGEELTIAESGRTVQFRTRKGETVQQAVGRLKNEVAQFGLDLRVELDGDRLKITHNKFGSDYSFQVASTTAGVLSDAAGIMQDGKKGMDIQGTIGGQVAHGRGQVLSGAEGTAVEGLVVRYTGDVLTDANASDDAKSAGRVSVYQHSLVFQVGGNVGQSVAVSLNSTNTRTLGRGVANASGFGSLRDVNVLDSTKAQDTMRLVDVAIDEVTRTRAQLGAFQKNTLESQMQQLRITAENLTSAESTIRDADMAQEIADYTKNSILVQSSMAMLAQANHSSKAVLTLIG